MSQLHRSHIRAVPSPAHHQHGPQLHIKFDSIESDDDIRTPSHQESFQKYRAPPPSTLCQVEACDSWRICNMNLIFFFDHFFVHLFMNEKEEEEEEEEEDRGVRGQHAISITKRSISTLAATWSNIQFTHTHTHTHTQDNSSCSTIELRSDAAELHPANIVCLKYVSFSYHFRAYHPGWRCHRRPIITTIVTSPRRLGQ